MKRGLLIAVTAGWALSGPASIILSDSFENGNLGTAPAGVNGGFYTVSSGSGGSVEEVSNQAQITSSANQNDVSGMLSTNTVSLNGLAGATALRTTWTVDSSSLKANSSSLAFTWQTAGSLAAPEIGVLLDLVNSTASLYVGDTNSIRGSIDLSADFGDPGEAFSLVATFNSGTFLVEGGGALRGAGNIDLSFGGTWATTRNFDEDYHLGALVQANGNSGLVVNVGSVDVEAIPEPAVLSLIGLCGGGMIFYRRIFAKKDADTAVAH